MTYWVDEEGVVLFDISDGGVPPLLLLWDVSILLVPTITDKNNYKSFKFRDSFEKY